MTPLSPLRYSELLLANTRRAFILVSDECCSSMPSVGVSSLSLGHAKAWPFFLSVRQMSLHFVTVSIETP